MNPTSERPGTPRIWGVAALVQAVGDALQARFGSVRVSGELSACTEAASGHRYFSLKDSQGQAALLRCAMFRRSASQLGFLPREGLKVEAVGRLALYEPRGDLQFIVESMQLVGSGSLYEEFLRLKARLSAEGLFDAARKRALPAHPRRIAVVSSLQAAALRDVLTVVARRAPHVEVVVSPCLVQGAEAPPTIVAALAAASQCPGVEAVILARGGGSIEDLWSFNDERVVRAVAQCPVPLVAGVGHETDVTLVDFAADVRAATPTAAAELLTPVQQDEWHGLAAVARRMSLAVQRDLDRRAQHLDQTALAVLRPAQVLARNLNDLQRVEARLNKALREPVQSAQVALQRRSSRLMAAQTAHVARAHRRWQELHARIQAQDPSAVLQRGYAWVSDAQGRPLTSVSQAQLGDRLTAVWHDGRAEVAVEAVHPRADGVAPGVPTI
jgi:exodeoxyribonuclease VII large subunit